MKALIVGVDIGTNNTVMTVIEDGNQTPTFIKTFTGEDMHGTYVCYPDKSTEDPIFGTPALEMLPSKNLVRLPKKALGAHSIRFNDLSIFNAEVHNPGKKSAIRFRVAIDGKSVIKTGKDVIVDFLLHIKEVVTGFLDGKVIKWVFSKPMYWNGAQARAFNEALEAAGITPLAILEEPTAAMFCYRAKNGEDSIGQKTCVVDIGAGTTDSVLQEDLGEGRYLTRCVGGDDLLGSSNLDEYLLAALKEDISKEPGYNAEAFDEQVPENREKMKRLKHTLSTLPKASVKIHGVTTKAYEFVVDQERKREIFTPFYNRLEVVLLEMFDRAHIACNKKYTAEEIRLSVEVVAMVGGGSKDTHVGNEILPKIFPPPCKIVGKPNQKDSVNPDVAVSMGNTYWGAAMEGTPSVKGLPPNPAVAPVLSQDLGVESVEGYGTPNMQRWFTSIIDSMTPIPTTVKKERFSTVKDDQKAVVIEVYQGIGRKTTEEGVTFLGRYQVPVETPNKAGVPNIEVEMEVFADSTLVVRAGEKGKAKEELTVDDLNL